jgi:AcrR family transcriptional regulator
MARQARSDATRRKIVNAAVDLFREVGYSATGLGDIIERAEMTKGAFYYHFDSKELLASAIIEEGAVRVRDTFRGICQSSSPALENIIHGTFVVADLFVHDKVAAIGIQLSRTFGEFNETASRTYGSWLEVMTEQARLASGEGDLRDDLDPDVVGESLIGAMLGAELISNAASGGRDLIVRLSRIWEIHLRAIATHESLPYFREFLTRESLRHLQPTLSIQ